MDLDYASIITKKKNDWMNTKESAREFNKPERRRCSQANGHGSATDMARRKAVREDSEREVGMFDMAFLMMKKMFLKGEGKRC